LIDGAVETASSSSLTDGLNQALASNAEPATNHRPTSPKRRHPATAPVGKVLNVACCTVPLAAVVTGAGSVQVPFENATILDAPSVAVGEGISDAAAVALRRYRLGEPATPTEGDDGPSGTEPLDAGPAGPAATTTAPMTTASTEPNGTMIRSEEELRVRMRRRARHIRVKRYVVTDYVTRTIPVRREELRMEPEELVDEANLTARPAPPGDGWEMVLHQEEVVVSKRVVAPRTHPAPRPDGDRAPADLG
jgi:hypothetical protein